MSKKFIIYGKSHFSRRALQILETTEHEVLAFIDEISEPLNFYGKPLLPFCEVSSLEYDHLVLPQGAQYEDLKKRFEQIGVPSSKFLRYSTR